MTRNILTLTAVLLAAIACACNAAQAAESAQAYPSRPIRFMVTYPPGGGTDLVARQVAQKLSEAWSQQVIIDNRPGGGGIIGAEIVSRSAPDGYTYLLGTSAALVTQPLLLGKAPYDSLKAFAPVSLLTQDVHTLFIYGSLPVNTLKELISYAKARPGQLNYASAGLGSPNHLNMELLKTVAGIDMVHVPYQGSGPSVTDLLAGRVQVIWSSASSLIPYLKTGRLKALAVGGPQRLSTMPDVPTVAEAGLPQFEPNMPWFSIFVPAGTPKPIITKINAEVGRILKDPDTIKRLTGSGYTPHPSTPEELGAHLAKEYARMKDLVQATKLNNQRVQ